MTLLEPGRTADPAPRGTTADPDPGGARPARRTVVLGALAAGVLAACGSDGEAGDTGTATSPAAGATPTPSPTAGTGGGGDVLAATSDVPVGGGVINAEAKVVVTQPTEGEFKGFSATCTHQACTVATVENGVIRCACHGSQFSVTDGSVQNGPATQPLPEVPVTVDGTNVVAT
jgi:Rieske Fe-S protein